MEMPVLILICVTNGVVLKQSPKPYVIDKQFNYILNRSLTLLLNL